MGVSMQNRRWLYIGELLTYVYLGKPDLFTHEFWSIFQTLTHHNSLDIVCNDLKIFLENLPYLATFLYKEN